ncbi:hypothetical protein FS799_16400 [Agrobacterium vitis]|uniref:hypothetical protein n=1 Tax=Agrobacterium vitis TaxID=373 RepID=UPI001F261BA7|nr:hypothetical protein [Agrobacterium vitis]MCE6076449.1 hypothetical protein [Agrobacterium vitis]
MKEARKFFGFWVPEPDAAEVASKQEERSHQTSIKDGDGDQDVDKRLREQEYEEFLWGMYPVH